MTNGTVKWFSAEKGYGFIEPLDGTKDVHLPKAAIKGDISLIVDGAKVSYEVTENDRGPQATTVSLTAAEPALVA